MLKEQVAEIRFIEDDLQCFPDGVMYLSERGMNKILNLFKAVVDKLTVIDDEEMKKAEDVYSPPTKEEWAINPDHSYWRKQRILNVQLQHTKNELDLMGE